MVLPGLGVIAGPKDDPDKILTALFRQVPEAPYRQVVTMRSTQNRPAVRMIVEGDMRGQTKTTVLEPVSQQGHVRTDNGREVRQYDPDSRVIRVMPSPRNFLPDPKDRLRLVEKAYRISVRPGPEIAGRDSLLVLAEPRHRGMPTRKIYVDQKGMTVLRLELSGTLTGTLLDTHSIEFDRGKGINTDGPSGRGWREQRISAPTAMRRLSDAGTPCRLELTALKPLPFGMVAQAIHLLEGGESAVVSVQFGDGLAFGFAYLYNADLRPELATAPSDGFRRTSDGVGVSVTGELPRDVMKSLGEFFLRHASRPR